MSSSVNDGLSVSNVKCYTHSGVARGRQEESEAQL